MSPVTASPGTIVRPVAPAHVVPIARPAPRTILIVSVMAMPPPSIPVAMTPSVPVVMATPTVAVIPMMVIWARTVVVVVLRLGRES
jgi:hypothetical protein